MAMLFHGIASRCAAALLMAQFTPIHLRPIEVGPFGYPVLVNDDAGNYSTPIKLYEDRDTAIYVPDFTSEAELYARGPAFQKDRRYGIVLYTFFKMPAACMRRLPPAKRADTDLKEACDNTRYKMENATIDSRAGTITTFIIMAMGPGARVYGNSIQQRGLTPPVAISARSAEDQESIRLMTALMHRFTDGRNFSQP